MTLGDPRHLGIVGVGHHEAVGREAGEDLGLGLGDRLDGAEELQVDGAHDGEDRRVRPATAPGKAKKTSPPRTARESMAAPSMIPAGACGSPAVTRPPTASAASATVSRATAAPPAPCRSPRDRRTAAARYPRSAPARA